MRARARDGFTLVELLVVLAIIGILAGIMLPVAGKVRYRGQVATTQGLIRNLEQAMEAYKADSGVYPEHWDPPALPPNGKPTFIYYLLETGRGAPYIDKSELTLSAANTPTRETDRLLDIWGHAFQYYRAPILGPDQGMITPIGKRFETWSHTNLPAKLAAFPGNKQSFNLWSVGANGLNESGTKGGTATPVSDDVVNWTTR